MTVGGTGQAAAWAFVLCCAAATDALDNGAARVPALGWSTWNAFGSNVSDAMVRESAAAIVKSGLRDAGYSYVNIDDGWACQRDSRSGELVPCPQFPNMTALGDHLHGLGLRFGLYTVWGKTTCASMPAREFHGSWGHVSSQRQCQTSTVCFLSLTLTFVCGGRPLLLVHAGGTGRRNVCQVGLRLSQGGQLRRPNEWHAVGSLLPHARWPQRDRAQHLLLNHAAVWPLQRSEGRQTRLRHRH